MISFQSFNNEVLSRISNTFLSKNKQDKMKTAKEKGEAISSLVLVKAFLRIGVFGTFFGHGINAILIKASWVPLITAFGFSNEFAVQIMPIIGILDVIIAISVLVYPMRLVLIWAIFWAFLTALSRPISGEPYIEFIERSSNWVTPLVLLFLMKKQK